MNILDTIAAHKRSEVQQRKDEVPEMALEILPHYHRQGISLKKNLEQSSTGIIAEFKRRSPSVPELNPDADVAAVTLGYEKAGASGLSVLTDEKFFGGSNEDLILAREQVKLPLLRKDFIIDPYQIHEAKAIGADVILLIAALLTRRELSDFSSLAAALGLEVLLEVHHEKELEKCPLSQVDMIGINNRNLKTFEVDLGISRRLSKELPEDLVRVSESGISDPEAIAELRSYGYQGFLVGGNFMADPDPAGSAAAFIDQIKSGSHGS